MPNSCLQDQLNLLFFYTHMICTNIFSVLSIRPSVCANLSDAESQASPSYVEEPINLKV